MLGSLSRLCASLVAQNRTGRKQELCPSYVYRILLRTLRHSPHHYWKTNAVVKEGDGTRVRSFQTIAGKGHPISKGMLVYVICFSFQLILSKHYKRLGDRVLSSSILLGSCSVWRLWSHWLQGNPATTSTAKEMAVSQDSFTQKFLLLVYAELSKPWWVSQSRCENWGFHNTAQCWGTSTFPSQPSCPRICFTKFIFQLTLVVGQEEEEARFSQWELPLRTEILMYQQQRPAVRHEASQC